MIELLEFIFRDFWTFLGFAFLLSIICLTLAGMVEHICKVFKR